MPTPKVFRIRKNQTRLLGYEYALNREVPSRPHYVIWHGCVCILLKDKSLKIKTIYTNY